MAQFIESSLIRRLTWITTSIIMILGFVFLTSEVREASEGKPESIATFDKMTSSQLINQRTEKMDRIAIDVTALGSFTVLSFLVGILSLYFYCTKKYWDAGQIMTAAIGSGIFTQALKFFVKIPRPNEIHRLVPADGFSFPSGHTLSSASIYITIAILIAQSLKSNSQRIIIYGAFISLILCVAISRIYLGVHFFSDVLGGILFGGAWAIAIAQARKFYF